ncbi:phosphate/phosphite/phosphonate ABC transporter substrate-binding protein [Fischerella thermalis]|uniref:Phosphonate ABC transporter substrate-binding protein n=1 Tax=Fischerella thermalis CCMEE 5318 TaxID=2019666 RepID=A0A2N6LK56_9CYAN|nr:PhnD/SsuA/transferrin family substrate-binding protein [Fischerella thermalis]PMB25092.1 phosphonate ABC transporter substrate-binding protein [Fischerella thermalis CCMEE 5318]
MNQQFYRRDFILFLLSLIVSACKTKSTYGGELTVGVINYSDGEEIINQYAQFNSYLGEKMKAYIQLEPAFNENQAIARLKEGSWSIAFTPPGLTALAISRYQYTPLFPLVGETNLRSIIVVGKDSPLSDLKMLEGQTLVLGQPGSATGYYLPLYNLYGLTLAEILFAPTPKTVLEWVAQGKASAGAVSVAELDLHASEFNSSQFRILFKDPHSIPPGVVLVGPSVERKNQEYIRRVLNEFPSSLAQDVGYVPNGTVPDYGYMIEVVERVKAIAFQLQNKPVRLF